jgi:chromosome segregation ATPase
MSDQTFFGKIGTWFKRGSGHGGDLPLVDHPAEGNGHGGAITQRSTFLRPWARRDQAIANLTEGFNTLTGLMGSIRDNLERQNSRQEELLGLLSKLPESLEGIPEASRIQSETLKAIHTQLATQNGNATKLGEILDRISQASNENRRTLEALDERFENLSEHDAAISQNLSSVGAAMQDVSRNSATSAEVLHQVKENMSARDAELERILHRQGTRFTTMLAVAIFLSIAALVACSVIGYLGYEALKQVK